MPIPDRGPPGWANRPRSVDTALPRRVCPDSVSPPGAPFETFLPHALFFRGDKIKERIAGDVDEVMRREQLFDLLARPASEKPKPVPNRSVFGTAPGGVEQFRRGADIGVAFDDDEPPAWP